MSLDKLMQDEIERDKIQKMLDDFCDLTGLAAVVNDAVGNKLSELVNVSAYCKEMRNKDGLCCLSDHKGATVAVNIGETCIYICHAGVVDFAIPLIVESTYIGSIMAGQVRTEEKLPFDFTSETTKEWMADQSLYEKYLMLPLMDKEQIQRSAKVLEIMRSYIVQRIENIRAKEMAMVNEDQDSFIADIFNQLKEIRDLMKGLEYALGLGRLEHLLKRIQDHNSHEIYYSKLLEAFRKELGHLPVSLPSDEELKNYDDFNKWGLNSEETMFYALYDAGFEQLLLRKYSRVKDELDYAVAYIQRYYYKKLTAGQVADYMNFSPDYFSRRFKKRFGISYSEYLTLHRLKIGKKFLTETDESIQWIAYTLGFTDAAYFTRVFKKHCHMSPTEYRRSH